MGHVSVLFRWPTQTEITATSLLSLARVKDALLRRNFDEAADLLWACMYDVDVRRMWDQCLGTSITDSLVGFIRRIQFDESVDTSLISLDFGHVRINPIFFLRFIATANDLIELVLHERDHRVLRILHGSLLFRGFSDAEFNLTEDVYIQARLRNLLNSTMVDRVRLALQIDAEIEQREQIRAIPVHARSEEERKLAHRPLRASLDPMLRHTLLTSKWRSFKGPRESEEFLNLLSEMEAGKIDQPYPKWVHAWRTAFPDPPTTVGRSCGHGPVRSNTDRRSPILQDDRHKVLAVDLPVGNDPSFAQAIRKTLDTSDPFFSDDAFRQIQHDGICLDQLVDKLVSPTFAHSVQNGTEYVSFEPTIDRNSIFAMSLGHYPITYLHRSDNLQYEDAWVLYVDVSGSMYRHYGIVASLARLLGPHCSAVKQFSEQVVSVVVDESRAWTTNGTDYNVVCQDILSNRHRRVIILTDNTEAISTDLMHKMLALGVEIHLVATNDESFDRDRTGFNQLAKFRTNLPPRP